MRRVHWKAPGVAAITCAAMLLTVLPALAAGAGDPDPSTLDGKVLLGYQGWFSCPGDGSPANNWRSWARGTPAPATLTIDMYPDLRELDPDEKCAVPEMTIQGKPAYLYSAWNPKTVDRHFQWMKQYGLDGVLVQRFVTSIASKRASGDVVLKNVIAGAVKHGRTFAIEYDITGSDPVKFAEVMYEDWKYLVDELKVTAYPNYQRHAGKPVLSIWGMGLHEDRHVPHDPKIAGQVVDWFKTGAEPKYRVTYMGGTPSRWRTLTNDARPEEGWAAVYSAMDVVQPWAVGRYGDAGGADKWGKEMIAQDLALAGKNKQMCMPVVFPGFSWHNLKRDTAPNRTPRNRGEFLWRQAYNAKVAGAAMLKIAMFDEVNEGTAIFKVAARRDQAPDQGYWLTLDADGAELPSDWYLRLAGEITRMFHGERKPAAELPADPLGMGRPSVRK
jgi:hypothetical protein